MRKGSRLTDEQSAKMRDDLRRLYVKYCGRNIKGLVDEMKSLGHTKFCRDHLYARGPNTIDRGLIEQLGLRRLLKPEQIRIGPAASYKVWLKKTKPDYTWSWPHQKHLFLALTAVTASRQGRLMVFMPPRHGKSEMVTIRYAAYRIWRNPKTRVIIASYNQRLANHFSRAIKRIVSAYVPLAKDRTAANHWETEAGGGIIAVGVGGGAAGFGADLVIADDPIKNRADAESATGRDKLWEWYCDDIHTRLEPGAALILIQTRWHVDDLAGRLIKAADDGGETFRVVSLPALAESDDPIRRAEGEALCPDRYTSKVLLEKKRQLGTYSFSAMYQQRPIPREGALFKPEYFAGKIVDRAPEGLKWARGYDLAVSTKTSADYTASFRVALDKQGNMYIADGFRRRVEFPEQRKYIIERIREERDTVHGIESALHGQAFVQDLMREQSLVASVFMAIKVGTDKFTRALSWANRVENGKVFLVRGAWIEGFLEEAYTFPAGKHDDQIDAVSLAVEMLSNKPKDKTLYRF